MENLPFAVVDHDRTPASRDYAYRFISSATSISGYADDERPSTACWRQPDWVALVIPPRFDERSAGANRRRVQVIIDGTFPDARPDHPGLRGRHQRRAVKAENMAQALSATARGVPLAEARAASSR